MKTLTKAFKIIVAIVAAVSLSAGAMNTGLFTKNNVKLITPNKSAGIDTTVYTMVDVMPNFPGGAICLHEFLSNKHQLSGS